MARVVKPCQGSEALDPGLWLWNTREALALTDPNRDSFPHRSRLSRGAFPSPAGSQAAAEPSGKEGKLQAPLPGRWVCGPGVHVGPGGHPDEEGLAVPAPGRTGLTARLFVVREKKLGLGGKAGGSLSGEGFGTPAPSSSPSPEPLVSDGRRRTSWKRENSPSPRFPQHHSPCGHGPRARPRGRTNKTLTRIPWNMTQPRRGGRDRERSRQPQEDTSCRLVLGRPHEESPCWGRGGGGGLRPGAGGGVGTWGSMGTEFPSSQTGNMEVDGADCTARPASCAPKRA